MNTTLQDLGVTSGDVYLLISYLIAAVFFVLGLKLMSHPETARKGNFWAAGGMGLALIYGIMFVMPIGGADMPYTKLVEMDDINPDMPMNPKTLS